MPRDRREGVWTGSEDRAERPEPRPVPAVSDLRREDGKAVERAGRERLIDAAILGAIVLVELVWVVFLSVSLYQLLV